MSQAPKFDPGAFRAVALDLDGTILNAGVLSPAVEQALGRVAQQGLTLVIATGRSLATIPRSLLALPFFRYVISSSGAQVTDMTSGTVIASHPIAVDTVLQSLALMKGVARSAHVLYPDVTALSLGSLWHLRRHMPNISRAELRDWRHSSKTLFSLPRYVARRGKPAEKVNFSFLSQADSAAAAALLKQHLPVEALVVPPNEVEVSPAGVNKATGMLALCAHLGLDPAQVLAIGDSANDFALLNLVGYAIVMGNADDALKKIAHRVAPHVCDDGATILAELFA